MVLTKPKHVAILRCWWLYAVVFRRHTNNLILRNIFRLQGFRKAFVMTGILAYGLFYVHRVETHVKARSILPYELDWFVLRPAKSLNQTSPITWIMCVICCPKFLSPLQFKTAVWDFLNGHLINGCRRQYLHTKVRCLTMSALYPAAVRVIQMIWCAFNCVCVSSGGTGIGLQWVCLPVLQYSLWRFGFGICYHHVHTGSWAKEISHPVRVGRFLSGPKATGAWRCPVRSNSPPPNSICVKLPTWTSLSDLLRPRKLSSLWLCSFLGV